jgi:hypothetical protein
MCKTITLKGVPTMTNESIQLERIGNLLDKYLVSFGQARVAFYIFPSLENYYDFTRYLNSFTSALKRANCRPVYSWSYDSIRGCYNMILLVNGYFRNDMNDVTDAAQRIWKLYSPFPIQFVAEMPIDNASIDQGKLKLFEIMNGMHFSSSGPQRVLPPHQRAFACSKLY